MKAAILGGRRIVSVTGEDATGFLHNLVTNSVEGMIPGEMRYAALLIPQGKIIADFFVQRTPDGFLIDSPQAVADDLIRRLTLYRLRAKIAIAPLDDHGVLALFDGAPVADVPADPRLEALGQRMIMPVSEVEPTIARLGAERVEEADYHRHRVFAGVPEGGRDFSYGDVFPHEADMDQLHGVDFRKGCYIGQEVVSRMHHRGTARTRIVPVRLAGDAEPGAEITAGGRPLGKLGSVSGDRGLALIRLDRAAEALEGGTAIHAGDATVEILRPDWAMFAIPGQTDAAQ